jgi:iron complex outermembrane receptor protein
LLLLGLEAAAQANDQATDDPVAGLETLLDTQIEGASRHAEKSLDAPANVSVIGRTEAAALGHVTLADMLARLPGTYVSTSRTYSSLGLRGLNRFGDYNTRILMAIDGYRVNDALYDQALPDYEFPIPADWIKRLELVSGPASSVYGGNALLGVVNAVTLDGADAPGLGLRANWSRAGSAQLTGQYGWHQGDADLFIGVALHDLTGDTLRLPELDGGRTRGGIIAGLDGTRYHSIMAKLRRGEWRTTLVAQAREKDAATAPYGTLPGIAGTQYRDGYAYLESVYEGHWRGDWRPTARFNLSRTSFRGRYVYASDDEARRLMPGQTETINRDYAAVNWAGVDARLHWRGWLNHSIVAGVELRQTLRAVQSNFDEVPARSFLNRVDRQTLGGLYLQDQMRLSERWLATVGARLDSVKGFEPELSPRLALIYRPGPNEAVKLMAGRAFRAPNLNERFYEDGGVSQAANPQLGPERVSAIELAWERPVGHDARLTLSAYRYQLRGLIDFVPLDDTVSRYENLSRGHSSGIDIDYERRLASRWQWRTSLSLARARLNGQVPTNSPRWLFKGHLFGPIDAQWSAGMQWQAIARREGERGPVPSYATADLVLRRALGPGSTAALVVRNIADRETWDPATRDTAVQRIPRERRRVSLDVRVAF